MSGGGPPLVTRLRSYAHCEVVETRPAPAGGPIRSDAIIRLGRRHPVPSLLRRILVAVPGQSEPLVLLTNLLRFSPRTVAEIYRERWQIEVFFRALKQTLRVKTFVGTSANALKVQIWTALIAMLLLKYLQLRSRFPWSLSNLVPLLRQQLFVYRDLWRWIHQPFQPPETPPPLVPLPLPLHA